ncbi:hypothetical protein DBR06_SOUSAS8410085, partial [Sousa chinensis]
KILYITKAYQFHLGSQDTTSSIMEELIHFHHHTIVIFKISSLVLYIISLILTSKLTHIYTVDAQVEKIYKYTDYEDLNVDASVIPTSELKPGE